MLKSKSLTGKPSDVMFKLQQMAQQCGIDEELVRIQFLNTQPTGVARILVSQNNIGLTELAKLADDIVAITEDNLRINTVKQQHPETIFHQGEEYYSQEYQPQEYLYQPKNNYHGYRPHPINNTNIRRQQPSNPTHSHAKLGETSQVRTKMVNEKGITIPYSVHPFTAEQRPKVCRFHLYYGDKARRCSPWCQWPEKTTDLQIMPSSRPGTPTPGGSGPPPNKRRKLNEAPSWGANCLNQQPQGNGAGVYY